MLCLQDNWDGLDAKAPEGTLLRSAINIAEIFRGLGQSAPSRATATVNGTVVFEWRWGDNYLEMEIVRPYQAENMLLSPQQPSRHWNYSKADFENMANSCPK